MTSFFLQVELCAAQMYLQLVDQRYADIRESRNYMAVIPADLAKLIMRLERSGDAYDYCQELQQLCIVPPGCEEFCKPGTSHIRDLAMISCRVVYCVKNNRALAFFKLADRVEARILTNFDIVSAGQYYIYMQRAGKIRILFILGENARQTVYEYEMTIHGGVYIKEVEPYILSLATYMGEPKVCIDLRSKTFVRA